VTVEDGVYRLLFSAFPLILLWRGKRTEKRLPLPITALLAKSRWHFFSLWAPGRSGFYFAQYHCLCMQRRHLRTCRVYSAAGEGARLSLCLAWR